MGKKELSETEKRLLKQRLKWLLQIESCKRAIAINPDLAEAHTNLGNAYAGQGKYDQAIESFQKAIAINPDFTEAHYNLGCAYSLKNEKNLSIEFLQKAIALDKKYIKICKTDSDFGDEPDA